MRLLVAALLLAAGVAAAAAAAAAADATRVAMRLRGRLRGGFQPQSPEEVEAILHPKGRWATVTEVDSLLATIKSGLVRKGSASVDGLASGFREFDPNGTGRVMPDKFTQILQQQDLGLEAPQIAQLVKVFEARLGDGSVDYELLLDGVRRHGEPISVSPKLLEPDVNSRGEHTQHMAQSPIPDADAFWRRLDLKDKTALVGFPQYDTIAHPPTPFSV
jgi:hypothetical protein